MALPLYLAQTAQEMAGNPLAQGTAYLACHFSPGGQGLSNLPEWLPEGSMLILDDSNPMDGHDGPLILKQLTEIITRNNSESVLLDFQRQDIPGQRDLAKLLTDFLPCPVGVSELYAQGLSCSVFLPPVPPDKPLSEYLSPWRGREIWLEAAQDGITLILTESRCSVEPLWDHPEDGLEDEKLHCHYVNESTAAAAIFHLWRTKTDLDALLREAEAHGVAKSIGLWQELG